jgi:SAM-dependent methyltransferase
LTLAPVISWTEGGARYSAGWQSEAGAPPPKRVFVADDSITADAAYRLASQGTALLWRGDFQNARQLLQAMARRIEREPRKAAAPSSPGSAEAFHLYRLARAQRARILGMLLLPFEENYRVPLRRAPDVRQACGEAYGPAHAVRGPFVASLRELLGLIGAHEWRRKGVVVPALGERIHPHYGVFAPIRGEYVDLVAAAPLPARCGLAFDIGTGSGVLAAVLARRGVARIVATDRDARALACAADNLTRLGLSGRVDLVGADLFPPGRAALVVCNPPWLPGAVGSPLEHAVYDPDSRMLKGFIEGLTAHLEPAGEAWLVLSDLAEHLGLRARGELLAAFDQAGLKVVGRIEVIEAWSRRRGSDGANPRSAPARSCPRHASEAPRASAFALWNSV